MYRFYRHWRRPNYRLVVRAEDPFPAGTRLVEWELTLERETADTGQDVRIMIAEMGYCLFRMGLTFDDMTKAETS